MLPKLKSPPTASTRTSDPTPGCSTVVPFLRPLPQIDADNAAGITDPTNPPLSVSIKDVVATSDNDFNLVPDEDADSDQDSDLDPDSDIDSDDSNLDTATETKMKTEAKTETETETETRLDSTNTWDPSIPEPDPRKKPS